MLSVSNVVRADSASTFPTHKVLLVTWGWLLEMTVPSRRKALYPQASTTLTFNVDGSHVWNSHNTSKYNAATLLRHESVGFKNFPAFLH